jgi:hypothetical protein
METILICLIVYAVIGVAFGIYDDAMPFIRRRCELYGGVTVRDALKVMAWLPLYAFFGSFVLVAGLMDAAAQWTSEASIWDKQIIRCGKSKD